MLQSLFLIVEIGIVFFINIIFQIKDHYGQRGPFMSLIQELFLQQGGN